MNTVQKQIIPWVLPIIPAIVAALLWGMPAASSGDDINAVCTSRCSGFTDLAYSRCVETCVRTTKKHRPRETKKVSQRMEECEEICSVYEGVQRVKCLRLCLDRNK
jgi:hypothetical protein